MPETYSPAGFLYVYVIGHDEGPQKIGISNSPPTRAKALKVAGRPHYTVHASALVHEADALGIERLAHWILRDEALGYERFSVTPATAEATVVDAIFRYADGERVPPRTDLMTRRVQLMVSQSFADAVEDWRAGQVPIPSWSEAVRILVDEALDARERTKPKPD